MCCWSRAFNEGWVVVLFIVAEEHEVELGLFAIHCSSVNASVSKSSRPRISATPQTIILGTSPIYLTQKGNIEKLSPAHTPPIYYVCSSISTFRVSTIKTREKKTKIHVDA